MYCTRCSVIVAAIRMRTPCVSSIAGGAHGGPQDGMNPGRTGAPSAYRVRRHQWPRGLVGAVSDCALIVLLELRYSYTHDGVL